MKVYIFASLLVAGVSASLEEQGQKFATFKATYDKNYSNQAEEITRFAIFQENLRAIEQHNELYAKGLVSFKKGINQFTDLTPEEFRARLILSSSSVPDFGETQYVPTGASVAVSVDWREQGLVTNVKNQGDCGSCWAFSITGSTEAAYFKKNKKLVSLSEQQLLDCSTKLNKGCSGGRLAENFPWVKENGLVSEASYPYKAKQGTCKYSTSDIVTKISSYVSIKEADEKALLEAVATVGPVSVGIDASDLSYYSSGIYDDWFCSKYSLNHAVLVVGYGSENGKDYWIVKNSWGSEWGEKGYFKLFRGTNQCGVAEMAAYPVIA